MRSPFRPGDLVRLTAFFTPQQLAPNRPGDVGTVVYEPLRSTDWVRVLFARTGYQDALPPQAIELVQPRED